MKEGYEREKEEQTSKRRGEVSINSSNASGLGGRLRVMGLQEPQRRLEVFLGAEQARRLASDSCR